MKIKLTLIMMQIDQRHNPCSEDFLTILVDEDYNLPFRYASTKTVEETLQEIYNRFCTLDIEWATPVLEDLRRVPCSTEYEALYQVMIPKIDEWNTYGYLVPPEDLDLENFYARAIIRQPRTLHRN